MGIRQELSRIVRTTSKKTWKLLPPIYKLFKHNVPNDWDLVGGGYKRKLCKYEQLLSKPQHIYPSKLECCQRVDIPYVLYSKSNKIAVSVCLHCSLQYRVERRIKLEKCRLEMNWIPTLYASDKKNMRVGICENINCRQKDYICTVYDIDIAGNKHGKRAMCAECILYMTKQSIYKNCRTCWLYLHYKCEECKIRPRPAPNT